MEKDKNKNLNGWLIIDKSLGMTSTQVIGRARRIIGTKKVGHVGTLDPLASGVLPIAIGEATKTINYLTDSSKEYVFTIFCGLTTETGDLENIDPQELEKAKTPISAEKIQKIIPQFLGKITQKPPKYSAIKVKGEALYKKARRGEEVAVPTRQIEIKALEIIEQPKPHLLTLRCVCGSGTYIRTLAQDLCEAIGEKGTVSMLRRTRAGIFTLKDSFSLEKLEKDLYTPPESQNNAVNFFVPLDKVLADILVLSIDEEQEKNIRHGKVIEVNHRDCKTIRLMRNTKLVAIASIANGKIKTDRVFNL
ncbi:MAG: tRNA pseudouridine(55) synthase TruB [Alphaproteobacteria bacterium]|nr:tRNA pseudouridine(55) synthase TruB [Alphaproteobacteria bacterium]